MDKKTIVDKIKVLLSVDTKLEQYALEDGTVFESDALEAGNTLFLVTPDGSAPAAAGEYVFGNLTVTVGEEGKIMEVVEAEVEAEETPAETPAETPPAVEAEETPSTVSLEEHNAVVQRVTDLEEIVEQLTEAVSKATLSKPTVEAQEDEPAPKPNIIELEMKNPKAGDTLGKVYQRINQIQFSDAN